MAGATTSGMRGRGLSLRLLLFTLVVVLLVEAFIYLPGVAAFRNSWLGERLSQARAIAMLIEKSPPDSLPPAVIEEVLNAAQISTIALRVENTRRLIASVETPRMVAYEIDLRWPGIWRDLGGTFDILLFGNGRTLRVIGTPPSGGDFVEIVLHEAPLREALRRFSWMILRDSLLISLLTALALYAALNGMIVAPVRRLAQAVNAFRERPESIATTVGESRRHDEIGDLERHVARMQESLRQQLRQREHLAQLGLAVAKINHDLRNMLASAQLLADRLGAVPDPAVQGVVPRLMDALDRAIRFCQSALAYGRAEERPPRIESLALAPVFASISTQMMLDAGTTPALRIEVAPALCVRADAEYLERALVNLVRNAASALLAGGPHDALIRLEARPLAEGGRVAIVVSDNGPGVPEKVRARLFQAFSGGARAGGTGLGLAIAQELARSMDGALRLETPQEGGARFVLELPAA